MVTDSVIDIRLSPPTTRFQANESSTISVLPDAPLIHYEDLNVNRVHHFEVIEPHSRLVIECEAIVSNRSKIDFDALPFGFHHAHLNKCCDMEECHPFVQDSEFIERSPDIWRTALDIQGYSEDVFQTSYLIMEHIFENYRYQSGTTRISSLASEVIESQQGSSQDFAHAMAALCRAIGVPARYVSGCFFDATPDHHLRGSNAAHAWVEVYIDGTGWIGFDPTNQRVVDESYIVMARGRDYHDVAPVTGVCSSAGGCTMLTTVQVDRLPEGE